MSKPYASKEITAGKAVEKRLPHHGSKRRATPARNNPQLEPMKISREELGLMLEMNEDKASLLEIRARLIKTFGKKISAPTISKILKETGVRISAPCRKGVADQYMMILRYENHLSFEEIAAIVQLSKGTVKRHVTDPTNLETFGYTQIFKDNKASIYEHKQHEILTSLNEKKIQNMSGKDMVSSITQLEDKIRTIRGEVTDIVSIEGIDKQLDDLEKEELALKKAINITPDKDERRSDEEEKLL